jgi:DNA-directed RNA polymerase specialized sigma24 family protein
MNDRDEEFGEFIRSCASLHQTAYLLCGDWHLAHDLVQDTLVKTYQHWHRVRQADSPDAYVRAILLNEVRGRWRRRERVVPVSRFPEGREPVAPDQADEITRRAGLLQALRRARVPGDSAP